ncbi:divergent polysaccharide deacetylase family protein [Ectothiorhodospira shaposhnikovii]|uniref:divergent polysaccharide deacetylase family protein n=1 Tax=Ectothiorhodospira shaposhnikovii TaxID=1054 RepID=UPI001EE9A632|nr:divergent polysaccharide deacetylase family protein [Ectothiorhodospira shaposhnikovii]
MRTPGLSALALCLCLFTGPLWAGERLPFIAIIIDDLGNDLREARRTTSLPGAVTCAVLPHLRFSAASADLAHQRGKEVMLHLPMEADSGNDPGPGAIFHHLDEEETRLRVRRALDSVPHVRGANNHMGSRLSREYHHLAWVMSELRAHDPALYYVDSRTHVETLGRHVAEWARLNATQRDVFLDSRPHDAEFVRMQMEHLIRLARTQGHALAIGHPYPATLQVLEDMLPTLASRGIRLLSVSEYLKQKEEVRQWHASLSPSPTAARNLKPSP